MRTGDLDPDRIVHRRHRCAAHLRRTCHRIRHEARPVAAGVLHPDTPVCRGCTGEYDLSETMRENGRSGRDGTAALLEGLDPEDVGPGAGR